MRNTAQVQSPLMEYEERVGEKPASPLTDAEIQALNTLAQAFNQFLLLPEVHPQHRQDFMAAMRMAQNIILARPVALFLRSYPTEEPEEAGHWDGRERRLAQR